MPSKQAVAAGMNPMDLRKGIKLATDHVVTVLSDISKPISTKEEVAQVGTISANRYLLSIYCTTTNYVLYTNIPFLYLPFSISCTVGETFFGIFFCVSHLQGKKREGGKGKKESCRRPRPDRRVILYTIILTVAMLTFCTVPVCVVRFPGG